MIAIADLEDYRSQEIQASIGKANLKMTEKFSPIDYPFIKGPVPLKWLTCALFLPGHSIHVGLALWYWSGVLKTKTIKLTNHKCTAFGVICNDGVPVRFGITSPTKLRALRYLEEAGLVEVHWENGKAPVVTIIDVY